MCMGLQKGDTAVLDAAGEAITEEKRRRGVGNAIHLSIMRRIQMSLLICKGYITMDDCRLKGQPWTENDDSVPGR